ncbi:MAG TPA: hypothetical protein VE954_25835 [Oligoflexus sp.]|uniref:hypothetical protein n=1 Tax=Oligoflexus sp. TaxID=1971216 RepID=UPI002D5C84A8|nr:hypothetical protein [Oligoflexus sp.]HYX36544.1 hypothetical protein [Oligoflexus sp.]
MRTSELKSALIITLLSMILLRLVWMDLRSYVITYAPQNRYAFDRSETSGSCRRSFSLRQLGPDKPTQGSWERPGWADARLYQSLVLASCRNGVFHDAGFVRYNQGLLISCLVFCVLLTRVMARSWVVGLIVAVALLSRGRLIAANGQISGDALIAVGFALWVMCLGHWLRSGSWWVYLGSYGVIAALMTLEPGTALLGFAPPLVLAAWRPILRRKMERAPAPAEPISRDVKLWKRWGELLNLSLGPAPDAPDSGGLFRPLPDGVRPLMGSLRFENALKTFTIMGACILFVTLLVQIVARKYGPLPLQPISGAAISLWFREFISPLDRDSGLGISMMVLALTWRSRWLPYLRPLVNLVGFAIILSALGAGFFDLVYLPTPAERLWQGTRLLILWEPVLMTLGMLAFYQMTLSLLARLDRIPSLTRFLKALK